MSIRDRFALDLRVWDYEGDFGRWRRAESGKN